MSPYSNFCEMTTDFIKHIKNCTNLYLQLLPEFFVHASPFYHCIFCNVILDRYVHLEKKLKNYINKEIENMN